MRSSPRELDSSWELGVRAESREQRAESREQRAAQQHSSTAAQQHSSSIFCSCDLCQVVWQSVSSNFQQLCETTACLAGQRMKCLNDQVEIVERCVSPTVCVCLNMVLKCVVKSSQCCGAHTYLSPCFNASSTHKT